MDLKCQISDWLKEPIELIFKIQADVRYLINIYDPKNEISDSLGVTRLNP